MLQRFRDRFGTAGVVVAVIALLVALGGTALAASGALTAKQRKEVEKIAKKFAGNPGVAAVNGINGAPGSNGKDGVGVTASAASEAECETGGVKVIAANGSSAVCNGEEGAPGGKGPTGSPWVAGGTLPPGKSETGTFSAVSFEGLYRMPISFSIPLAEKLPHSALHLIEKGQTAPAGCEGGTREEPKASPGNLCVYEGSGFGLTPFNSVLDPEIEAEEAIGKAGVVLQAEEFVLVYGTWILTAPEP